MAVAEAMTNITAADIDPALVKLSANWMAACGAEGEDAKLFAAVKAASEYCQALNVSIPVGKDSCSMRTAWDDKDEKKCVTSPVSLIVSAAAPVGNVRLTLTPLLRTDKPSVLALFDLSGGRARMGASILAQVAQSFGDTAPDAPDAQKLVRFVKLIRKLTLAGCVTAYHDRSDGGLAATLSEMMFASHVGLDVTLDGLIDGAKDVEAATAALFNEEIGAVVQIPADRLEDVKSQAAAAGLSDCLFVVARINTTDTFKVTCGENVLVDEKRTDLMRVWSEVSHEIARGRDNPACADSELEVACGTDHQGLFVKTTFDPEEHPSGPSSIPSGVHKAAFLFLPLKFSCQTLLSYQGFPFLHSLLS